jgi:Fe-coproporphyrin III synthase
MNRALKKINKLIYPQKLFFPPEYIILGVNNICNLHCKMCDVGVGFKESHFYDHMMGAQPTNMPLDLVKKVVDDIEKYFPKAKLGFAFTEPIIYPHLIESLAYADTKGIYTSMTTNGSKLPKLAKELCEVGLNELCISLDGPQEIHNAIRGNRNSFQWAIDGIKEIVAQPGRKPDIKIYCAINETNIGHLSEFASYFREFSIQELGFMHYTFVTDNMAKIHNEKFQSDYAATSSNMTHADFEKFDLNKLHEEIQLISSASFPFPITFSPHITDRDKLNQFYLRPEEKIGKTCNNIFTSMMIKSNGDCIPAHSRCYQVNAGNMYKSSLKEIWNSASISQFRKTIMENGGMLPACTRCCSAY